MPIDADWGAVAASKAPGFKTACDVVELGAGDFSRSLALAARHPDKRFLTTDYAFSDLARANLPATEGQPNVAVATLDARTIELPPESADFIFSIALMEHIAELDQCLHAVWRALRPGGVYFYVQAPFWTCAQGHHFRHALDETYEFIPKYAHLTHDRDGLAALLRAGPTPPFNIERCVEHIYGRRDLSRLGRTETREIVARGPLELVSWKELPDRRYDDELARAAHPLLLKPVPVDELAVSGAEVVLRKRRGVASRLRSRARRRAAT